MRLRFNFLDGHINEVDSTDTVLVSSVFAQFPDVNPPDHIHIILDPTKVHGEPEMVWITGHVAGSDTVSVERAQEDTTARLHPHDTLWVHGVVASDFEEITGPQGPVGPEGPAGPDFRYVHQQSTPESMWTINHNLNGFPNVTVVDSADEVVEGQVFYQNNNTIRLEFRGAFSGKAYLS